MRILHKPNRRKKAIVILINILSAKDKLSSGNREFFEESRIKKSPKVIYFGLSISKIDLL